MKKSLFFVSIIASLFIDAQVGINTNSPTEMLDVNGNTRVRELVDGRTDNNYRRVVVSRGDGTLGYKYSNEFKENILLNSYAVEANGLVWNTKNDGQVVDENYPHLGVQDNFNNYLLFGNNNNLSAKNGGWTGVFPNFEAEAGQVLNIKSLLSFSVWKNFVSNNGQSIPMNTVSIHGDRQVILYLFLYKGTSFLKVSKQVFNFKGIESGQYDTNFTLPLNLNYVVPAGQGGSDYNVSIVVTARAPLDGNFRVNFDKGVKQYLSVTRR